MSKQKDPQKAEVFNRIESIAEILSNTVEGRFSLYDVTSQLATFYASNPSYRNAWAIAQRDVQGWDQNKRPKDDPQGKLFRETFIIPTGVAAERIFMSRAKREHLIGWRKVEVSCFEPREAAYNRRLEYIDSRLELWDITKYSTLGDLEHDLFNGN
jgi:hypothetical protein